MPQKKNPDAAELMRASAPRLAADLAGLLGVQHGLPLAYNTDLREDKRYLFDAVDCLEQLLPVVQGMLEEVTYDEQRMAAACDQFLAATDVADYLVERGVPFREAHHLTGALVRRCLESGAALAQVPLEDLRALSPAFEDGYYALHDPATQLARKRSRGGSAPVRVREQLVKAREALAARPCCALTAVPAAAGSSPGRARRHRPRSAFAAHVRYTRRRDLPGPAPAVVLRALGARRGARPHRLHLPVRTAPAGASSRPRRTARTTPAATATAAGPRATPCCSGRPATSTSTSPTACTSAPTPPARRRAWLRASCCAPSSRARRRAHGGAPRPGRAAPSGLRPGAARPGPRHRPRAQRAAAVARPAGHPAAGSRHAVAGGRHHGAHRGARRRPEAVALRRRAQPFLSRPLSRTPILPPG